MAALVLVLDIAGFLINGIHQFDVAFYWACTSLLYVAFWFSVVYAIISLKQNSGVTALALVSAWIVFLVLIPSFINSMRPQENAERVELSDAEREFGSHLWDLWQSKTTALADTLFLIKPEWRNYFVKDTETINSVAYSYFDMLHLNQEGRTLDSLAANEQQRLEVFNYINPAYTAQQAFNQIAATELYAFVDYRKAAAAYQKLRSEAIHELRLSARPFTIADFKSYPVFTQPQNIILLKQFLMQLVPLILISVVCIVIGSILFKNT